jgi:SAM-dependent methyltransferase
MDERRSGLHGMWASVAEQWGEHADYVDARGAETTAALLDLTDPRPGDRVLELACGPGSVGLAAAGRIAPGGEVVLSDVAAEMTQIAAARAEVLGLANVSARVLDVEAIDEPDAAYHVVLCREGLMFALDPARAAGEIHRVLRPGGRVALAVWGPRERNPWLGLVLDAVGAQLGMPLPPPGVPGPFSLADAGTLAGLLGGAGLTAVEVTELAVPLHAESFEAWWKRTSALAGPVASLVGALDAEATGALHARLRAAVEPFTTNDGALDFPGITLLASAQRPADQ